jgi:hypothetical protein
VVRPHHAVVRGASGEGLAVGAAAKALRLALGARIRARGMRKETLPLCRLVLFLYLTSNAIVFLGSKDSFELLCNK